MKSNCSKTLLKVVAAVACVVTPIVLVSAKRRASRELYPSTLNTKRYPSLKCPSCGLPIPTDKACSTTVRTCKGCAALLRINCKERLVEVLKESPDTHFCSECVNYNRSEGNWFFTRGGGTCEKDMSTIKIMKMPYSSCHCGSYEKKSMNSKSK